MIAVRVQHFRCFQRYTPQVKFHIHVHVGDQTVGFPNQLVQHGATESLLQWSFIQCSEGETYLCWMLDKPVTLGFYRELHKYLKKWPTSHSATKTTVGRFYLLIDSNFQTKRISSRPDNIYAFIQRLVDSRKPDSDIMSYGSAVDKAADEMVTFYKNNLERMSSKVSNQQKDLSCLMVQLEQAKAEIASSQQELSDVTKKLNVVIKQKDCANRKLRKCEENLEATVCDSMYYEEELMLKNEELCDLVESLRKENDTPSISTDSCQLSRTDRGFCFKTKDGGHVYTTKVRALYYTLLAQQ